MLLSAMENDHPSVDALSIVPVFNENVPRYAVPFAVNEAVWTSGQVGVGKRNGARCRVGDVVFLARRLVRPFR